MASEIPPTMRAWQYSQTTGGLEQNLVLKDDVPVPTLSPRVGDKELLIEVLSASINPSDYKIAELPLNLGRAVVRTPATPAWDFCGRVVKTTNIVDNFRVGEIVFGRQAPTQHGACGQYIVASANACASLPSGVDVDEAASLPCAGLTAYQTIAPNVKPGDKVFLNGGSGGVGSFGIQIAKALGCHVTVSCSAAKAEQCKALGADDIIDYTAVDVCQALKERGQVFKLSVDNVGLPAELYKAGDDYLLPDGKFVQVGGPVSLAALSSTMSRLLRPSFLGGGKRKFQLYTLMGDQHQDLAILGQMVAEGKIKPVVEHAYDFEDVPTAFRDLRKGKTHGKLVIHVSEKGA
ncbi:NAD(P)-binding protein [Neurospora crassa]|uniref:Reticulon-4-interacting protein 1 n=1 Tax=Neurospora crassa (strain ATCC 24698 / 74-OR23-1A / CBS 708.71 / DSM 1257 / FGSC 987) TaxID=367110 RepID=Q7S3S7_NEUCR|nr:reticulon-4-interacting protein 1 [Neurospora crassa OR74A]EAA30152.1 reticulon-4-interacting protein 1 [Neurospora crassa OR74A]KHE81601.1 NAD(P)-binding protein [Neurospora crassa]|eukprot:XP_959388.1 reticulon-4-interacting protein 1 [Neurospora crassa OR74A]